MHATSFGISYFNTVNSLSEQLASNGLSRNAGSEVSHAYAAIKLWLLLAQRAGDGRRDQVVVGLEGAGSDIQQRRIWNEAWPPFERLLGLSVNCSDEASAVSFL